MHPEAMSTTTPRPLLLSDERINDPELTIPLGTKMVRDHYEATWGPLIQQLVDALEEQKKWLTWIPLHHMDDADQSECIADSKNSDTALSAASQHGFTPSQP